MFFRRNIRTGKKCDLSDFDCGMIVCARQGGLNISETADLGFSRTTVSIEFAKLCGQKHLVNERLVEKGISDDLGNALHNVTLCL